MEEIGALFGDEGHVASQWYGLSQEEKDKIAQEALASHLGKDVRMSLDDALNEKSRSDKAVTKVEDIAAS